MADVNPGILYTAMKHPPVNPMGLVWGKLPTHPGQVFSKLHESPEAVLADVGVRYPDWGEGEDFVVVAVDLSEHVVAIPVELLTVVTE